MDKINAERMILIGSSERNSGKTMFAKFLINNLKGKFPIVALKITTIQKKGDVCPRGSGCGACVIGGAHFILEEETKKDSSKDTSQLLNAGADSVFWLRSYRNFLIEAYLAFLEKIPENALIICESNSLFEIVTPACFITICQKQMHGNQFSILASSGG